MSFEFIEASICQSQLINRYRERTQVKNQFDNLIEVSGKRYVNFSSNDYLGLAADKSLHSAMQQGIDRYGTSSVSSSLISGYHDSHKILEESICLWLGCERAILFTSGFSANEGVLSALDTKNTHFLLDKLSHASLIDGARHTCGKFERFLHNNAQQLNKKLQFSQSMDSIVVTESVFSMDGDKAPLKDIQLAATTNNAMLYVDDAHGLGVLGQVGEGASSELEINESTLLMGTFGKALATSGAFVAGSQRLTDFLINNCRHYIYSTAMSPAIAWTTNEAIKIVQAEHWRREKIKESTKLFKDSLDSCVSLTESDTSIIGVVVGDEAKTLSLAEKLKLRGYWLVAIRPPTVPQGECRLRVTINARHKRNEIKGLANAINQELRAW